MDADVEKKTGRWKEEIKVKVMRKKTKRYTKAIPIPEKWRRRDRRLKSLSS